MEVGDEQRGKGTHGQGQKRDDCGAGMRVWGG